MAIYKHCINFGETDFTYLYILYLSSHFALLNL